MRPRGLNETFLCDLGAGPAHVVVILPDFP